MRFNFGFYKDLFKNMKPLLNKETNLMLSHTMILKRKKIHYCPVNQFSGIFMFNEKLQNCCLYGMLNTSNYI